MRGGFSIRQWCGGVCDGSDVTVSLVNPSLQVLRAGTMVERFTARMHVAAGDPPRAVK